MSFIFSGNTIGPPDVSMPTRKRFEHLPVLLPVLLFIFVCVSCSKPIRNFTASKPPVILITIDTLRADHLGCYGYPSETSPTLDKLAENGILFENHYTVMTHTLPSHCSIMTALFPREHEVLMNGWRMRSGITTLAELFLEQGYETGAFVGSKVLDRDRGLATGFEVYEEGRRREFERDGEAVNKDVLRWLENRSGPFFLWIHYWDPHYPYSAPKPFNKRYNLDDPLYSKAFEDLKKWYPEKALDAKDPERIKGFIARLPAYDNEVAYTDHNVGVVLAKLREISAYEPSIICVTSDHGEGFGEHSNWTHGMTLNQEEARVPLILKLPGETRQRSTYSGNTSSVQIAPSLLSLAGIPVPKAMARELFPPLSGSSPGESVAPVFSERRRYVDPPTRQGFDECQGDTVPGRMTAVWHSGNKYIKIEGCPPEVYNLADDPLETRNLAESPEAGAGLLAVLDENLAEWELTQKETSDIPDQALDGETIEQLRALGYIR